MEKIPKDIKNCAVNEALRVAERLKRVTIDIQNGIPEAQACRAANININAYRRFIFHEGLGFHTPGLPKLEKREHILFSPEEYLFAELIGCEKRVDKDTGIEIVRLKPDTYIPPDLKDTIPYILNTLDEKEQKIIRMRYYDRLSYEEIGGEIRVTRERVRQLLEKALKKLKSPTRMNYILCPDREDVMKEQRRQLDKDAKYAKAMLEEARRLSLKKNDENIEMQVKSLVEQCKLYKAENGSTDVKMLRRNGILDVNIFRGLMNADITDLKQLEGKTKKEIQNIRTFGTKRAEFIMVICEMLGVKVKE